MNSRNNPNTAASALVALFAAAVVAGYTSADLWQMAIALAMLIIMTARLGNR